jgi:type I restriction enzyme M protein
MKNKYCNIEDLTDEADVESFFLTPLFADLGYKTSNIKPKKSLEVISVGRVNSRRSVKHRPDYAIKFGRDIRLIFEAKSPKENLDDHILQPRDYSLSLNGTRANYKPVQYFVLTNGAETRVYVPDLNDPAMVLKFKDFSDGSTKFLKLREMLRRENLESTKVDPYATEVLEMRKAPLKDVNEAFSWCHQHIYKTDSISQGAAFMEFVKIIALKLLSDKKIRDKYPNLIDQHTFQVPLADVKFSKHILLQQEEHSPNPLSSIWFANFIQEMEKEIAQKKKKRIFEKTESIQLSPETIIGVVNRLECLFLFGIDADLNGRLFETFLSATMRGKDLGQYFTPRSVVKLGVGLAQIRIDFARPEKSDVVYDGCCGTGGFLIDVLADMWQKVHANAALSSSRKESICNQLANKHIYGADISRDPNLSRIARLNMYLHGDGGSSIYNVDALDKKLPAARTDNAEMLEEKEQMRNIINTSGGFFDVVVTNPPFAKKYSAAKEGKDGNGEKEELSSAARILKEYELLRVVGGKEKNELSSNLMFIEQYRDLLKAGGRLVTVLDDGLLSGQDYAWFRNWLRGEFIINAVISLPGDAFQRSAARVKTSILVLTKKREPDEAQPPAFMYPCVSVGIDDPARARTLPIDRVNRELAKKEIELVLRKFGEFQRGGVSSGKYIVPAANLTDRLDVKHCLMSKGAQASEWKRKGLSVYSLGDLAEPAHFSETLGNVIDCENYDEEVVPLIVRYDGRIEAGPPITPSDTQHGKLFRVSAGQLVVSNIAASYGSIALVPKELAGSVVSSEYTVLQAKRGFDPKMLCAILRSPVVLSELLLVATGANRTRVKWEAMRSVVVPYPDKTEVLQFVSAVELAEKAEKEAIEAKRRHLDSAISALGLRTERADTILSAFKPPK